jgi:hypothetical protein
MIGGRFVVGVAVHGGGPGAPVEVGAAQVAAVRAGEHLIVVMTVEDLADQVGEERGQVHVAGRVRGFGWAERQLAADLVQRPDVRVDGDDAGAEVGVGTGQAGQLAPSHAGVRGG